MSIELHALPAWPQSQESLSHQMAALIQVANRLGLCDAADAVKQMSSKPPPPGRKPAADQSPIRFDEGTTQRGNGNGGPTTPQPPIKPQPREVEG